MGRLISVTNGCFQVSEFNDSFQAINLKKGRSPGDPEESLNPYFQKATCPRTVATSEPIGTKDQNGRSFQADQRGKIILSARLKSLRVHLPELPSQGDALIVTTH